MQTPVLTFFSRWRSVGLVLLWAAALTASAKTPGEVDVGSLLREATLRGLNGPDRKLSDFRGRPLIINVWASWCPPCIREMGSLESLAWSDAGQQFMVIGISTDDYPQAAKGLLQKTKATLNHFIDERLALENMLGADHLPLTVLVDANGRVLEKVVGAREWDTPASVQHIQQVFRLKSVATPLARP
jgi:thiol-disulfide isomerase/thioredoxin